MWTVEVRLILLCFSLWCLAGTVCLLTGNSASDVPIGTVSPTAFARFVSPSLVLVILKTLQTFHHHRCLLVNCDLQSLVLLPWLTGGSDDGSQFSATKYF